MDKRLLSVDPQTGLMTWHSYDPLEDKTIISYTADSTPVLEKNKELRNDEQFSKNGIKNEFWLYARIPVMVQLEWLINHGVDINNKDHSKKMGQLLNDPQYQHLKTTTKNHRFK